MANISTNKIILWRPIFHLYTHTHTHTHIYIYIYIWGACARKTMYFLNWVLISSFVYSTILFTIIILSCHQHVYPWSSLATSPYRSLLPVGPEVYVPYPHRATVCRFELAALLLQGHVRESIGVHHLWARPYLSSSFLHVWFWEFFSFFSKFFFSPKPLTFCCLIFLFYFLRYTHFTCLHWFISKPIKFDLSFIIDFYCLHFLSLVFWELFKSLIFYCEIYIIIDELWRTKELLFYQYPCHLHIYIFVCWIHRLYLCRGVSLPNECPGYDTK